MRPKVRSLEAQPAQPPVDHAVDGSAGNGQTRSVRADEHLGVALPSASNVSNVSNVSLLAERYGADNGRAARIIMTSTVLSFLSFSALAWVIGVRQR